MSKKELKINDLVWAKMKGFSPWPGRIVEPPADVKKAATKNKNGPQFCVFFFGSKNYGWIEQLNCKPYLDFKDELIKSCKTATFKEAVAEIEAAINDPENNIVEKTAEQSNGSDDDFDKLRDNDEIIESVSPVVVINSPAPKRNSSVKKKTPSVKKLKSILNKSSADVDASPPTTTPNRRKRKLSNDRVSAINSDFVDYNSLTVSPPKKNYLLDRPVAQHIEAKIADIDVETVTPTLKNKNIIPSTKKFGFLGLGIMGGGMVKNLLNSGHTVYVWNRTMAKCEIFVKAGAIACTTPSDVVEQAEIIFSCVTDPCVAKELVFGNCGVLSASNFSGKGYVEMTGIDHETSADIADGITGRGGMYLEAQIQGSKKRAEEGALCILTAGDRDLFNECETCFSAIGENSFFLGETGNATKMNLVLQSIAGITIAAVGEAFSLADRASLEIKDVMEILKLTSMSSELITDKGNAIMNAEQNVNQPLSHMQKDLRLALGMADTIEQPLPLIAASNEVFKHAKRMGYGNHDSSAVWFGTRY